MIDFFPIPELDEMPDTAVSSLLTRTRNQSYQMLFISSVAVWPALLYRGCGGRRGGREKKEEKISI